MLGGLPYVGSDRVRGLGGTGEVGGPDRDRPQRGHVGRDLLGLGQPDLVEGYVGVALGAAGVVPGGAPVPQEDQAPHVRVSAMAGQSLEWLGKLLARESTYYDLHRQAPVVTAALYLLGFATGLTVIVGLISRKKSSLNPGSVLTLWSAMIPRID